MIIIAKKKKVTIKTRKMLALDYYEKYGHIDLHGKKVTWLKDYLGEYFNQDTLNDALERRDEIKKKMTYSKINFVFEECPAGSHRPRVNFRTKSMRTPNAKENSQAIEQLVMSVKKELELIVTPMRIKMKVYHPMPKLNAIHPVDVILYEMEEQYCFVKPDFDNILKSYADMIQKHIILDDDLVCKGVIEKYFSIKPRVEMEVKYQDNFASKYAYDKIRNRKLFSELAHRVNATLLIDMPKKKKGMKKNGKNK